MISSALYASRVAAKPRGIFVSLMEMIALARSRSALANLDDAALADVGLSRDEARAEAARPVWDVPATWKC